MAKTKHEKEEDKLAEGKRKRTIFCPNCGNRIHFYAFERQDRQFCDWCGRYVFKDKKSEYDYRMKELLNKQRRG